MAAWQELSSHFCSWLDLEVSLSGWLARTELVMIRRLIQILGQWNSYVVTCNDSSTWLVWYACTTAAHYVRQYTHVGGKTSSLVFFHRKAVKLLVLVLASTLWIRIRMLCEWPPLCILYFPLPLTFSIVRTLMEDLHSLDDFQLLIFWHELSHFAI